MNRKKRGPQIRPFMRQSQLFLSLSVCFSFCSHFFVAQNNNREANKTGCLVRSLLTNNFRIIFIVTKIEKLFRIYSVLPFE